MLLDAENIKNMTVPEKAKLFSILRNDKELEDYMISNSALFEELDRRDKAYTEGKIKLTTRQELSLRLKKRRDAL
jgi:soluble cytochrome b562